LLEKVKERRFVKGQTYEETCIASGKWNVNDEKRGETRASKFDTKNASKLIGISQRGGSEINDDIIIHVDS